MIILIENMYYKQDAFSSCCLNKGICLFRKYTFQIFSFISELKLLKVKTTLEHHFNNIPSYENKWMVVKVYSVILYSVT